MLEVILKIGFKASSNACKDISKCNNTRVPGILNLHTFFLLACSFLCPLEAVSLVAGLPCFPPVLHHLVMFTDGTSPGIKFFGPCILASTTWELYMGWLYNHIMVEVSTWSVAGLPVLQEGELEGTVVSFCSKCCWNCYVSYPCAANLISSRGNRVSAVYLWFKIWKVGPTN